MPSRVWSRLLPIGLLPLLLVSFLWWSESQIGRADDSSPIGPRATVRTLVIHEVSNFTSTPTIGAKTAPVLSRDGSRVAFSYYRDNGNYNDIYVMNADGSDQQKAGSFTGKCFCSAQIDISDDGSKVLASESAQIYLYQTDGSGGQLLLDGNDGSISSVRLSGDGSKVFFMPYRDMGTADSSVVDLPRGVWVMSPDGTGRRQIVSASQVASVLGTTPDKVYAFSADGPALDVSTDGSKIVFVAQVASPAAYVGYDYRLMGVNLDGSNLHLILGSNEMFNYITSGAISGDGATVAYQVVPGSPATGYSTWPSEAGVLNFDGSGRRTLVTNSHPSTPLPDFSGACRNQLNQDGSLLMIGCSGLLFRTDGSGGTELVANAPAGSDRSVIPINRGSGVGKMTMDRTGTRFLFLAMERTFGGPLQLATLDINPTSLGAAPTLSNPAVSPSYVLTASRSTAVLSATVSTVLTGTRLAATILRNGFVESCDWSHAVLVDDGTGGDPRAGDGNYSFNDLRVRYCPPPDTGVSPRTIRFKAGGTASDGRRHETAVEIDGFEVAAQAPSGTATPTATTTGTPSTPTPTATATATSSPGAGNWRLDPTFGSGGLVTTTVGNGNTTLTAIALQSDGKFVAVGRTERSAGANAHDWAIARYTGDGSLDPSFGSGGLVTTRISSPDDGARAVGIQADGKIVVAGYCEGSGFGYDWCLIRYTATGAVDTSFGTNGTVRTTWATRGGSGPQLFSSYPNALAIQSDGKIVVTGHTYVALGNSDNQVALARYNSDGSLDSSFGAAGKVVYNHGAGGDGANAVAIQSDGRIVLVGTVSAGGVNTLALWRYTSAGALDTSFGSSGLVTTQFGSASTGGAVALQSDGKILAGGQGMTIGGTSDFAAARYTTAGALDTTFGSSGKVTTDFAGGNDAAVGLGIQTGGQIVAGGFSFPSSGGDFAVARYTTSGVLDTTFTASGRITTSFAPPPAAAQALALRLQPDDKIVLAGSLSTGSQDRFALARYAPSSTSPTHSAFIPFATRGGITGW